MVRMMDLKWLIWMMNKYKRYKLLAICMALTLAAGTLLGTSIPVSADGETREVIRIRTAEDFAALSENCHEDAWTRGKLVLLEEDIVLTAELSQPLAVFSGEFDGQGHTIDGFVPKGYFDRTGLFGELREGAYIHDLTVGGMVTPSGIQSQLGGIAGVNSGRIEGCTFRGTVDADAEVGGIAAHNNAGGIISDCRSEGTLQSNSYVGGICGYNEGTIAACENAAAVDKTYTDVPISRDELSNTLENILMTGKVNTTENIAAKTDIGGIAGFNSGVVAGSRNEGIVGCEHIGYNVGGIAGRSSGYLTGCANTGSVSGRKDVGGIAGQMQPYLEMDFTQSTLQELDSELDTLSGMVDSTLGSASGFTDALGSQLQGISDITKLAQDNVEALTGAAADDADRAAGRANNAIYQTQGALSGLADASGRMSEGVRQAHDAAVSFAGQVETYLDETMLTDEEKQAIRDQVPALREGADKAQEGAARLSEALRGVAEEIGDGTGGDEDGPDLPDIGDISIPGTDDVDVDLGEVKEAIADISSGLSELGGAVSEMLAVLEQHAADHAGEEPDIDTTPLYQVLHTLSSATSNLMDQLRSAGGVLSGLDLHIDGVSSGVRSASSDLYTSLDALQAQMDAIENSVHAESKQAIGKVQSISHQIDKVMRIVEDAANGSQPEDPADSESDSDSETVLGQKVTYLTDEEITAATLGRTTDCRDEGLVSADLNGGGIVGTMNVEYDLDPEQDIVSSGSTSLNYAFQSTCVVDSCRAEGALKVGGNSAGGIAGLMQNGVIAGCVSTAEIRSGGDYVGGIAGYSATQVRQSTSVSRIYGSRYVGGITGYGSSVRECLSAATIFDAVQHVGAISGGAKQLDDGYLAQNYFYAEDLYGVDGISYEGMAERVSYEQLQAIAAGELPAPAETAAEDGAQETEATDTTAAVSAGTGSAAGSDVLATFEIVFLTEDDEVLDRISCRYGESIDPIRVPAVPKKEGFLGTWSRGDFSNITGNDTVQAQYQRILTMIAGRPVRDGGNAVLLIEGSFLEGDVPQMQDTEAKHGGERYEVVIPQEALQGMNVQETRPGGMDGQEADTDPQEAGELRAVRFLPEDPEADYEFYVSTGEEDEKVSAEGYGAYRVIMIPSGAKSFAIEAVKKTGWLYWLKGLFRRSVD